MLAQVHRRGSILTGTGSDGNVGPVFAFQTEALKKEEDARCSDAVLALGLPPVLTPSLDPLGPCDPPGSCVRTPKVLSRCPTVGPKAYRSRLSSDRFRKTAPLTRRRPRLCRLSQRPDLATISPGCPAPPTIGSPTQGTSPCLVFPLAVEPFAPRCRLPRCGENTVPIRAESHKNEALQHGFFLWRNP